MDATGRSPLNAAAATGCHRQRSGRAGGFGTPPPPQWDCADTCDFLVPWTYNMVNPSFSSKTAREKYPADIFEVETKKKYMATRGRECRLYLSKVDPHMPHKLVKRVRVVKVLNDDRPTNFKGFCSPSQFPCQTLLPPVDLWRCFGF